MFTQGRGLALEDIAHLRGEKLAFTIDEARYVTGLGKPTLYRLI